MRFVALTCTVAVAALVSTPALAQMKTGKTAAPAATPAPSAAVATVAAGDDAFRPTSYLGVEKAQILSDGITVFGLGGGLDVSMGWNNLAELRLNGPVVLQAGAASSSALPSIGGKMMLMSSPNLTVGVGVDFPLLALSPTIYAPIGLGKLGPGELTVTPMVQLPLAALGGMAIGARAGYEMPLLPRWDLEFAEGAQMVPSAGAAGFTNTLQVGMRGHLTPNFTADIGGITLNTTGAGNTFTLTFLSLGASWGGRTADFPGFFGF